MADKIDALNMELNEKVYEVTMKVEEKCDEFIFSKILPYCENIMQTVIPKKTLVTALKKQKPLCPVVEEPSAWNSFRTLRFCGRCGTKLTLSDKYCRHCGQAVRWT